MRAIVFELGAQAYDFLTGHRLWREQIKKLLDHAGQLPPRPRVLDLGCGPGVSAFVLAQALGPDAEVMGIDFAERMIARAEHHHRVLYPELQVRFLRADAAALPFADASFDLITGHSFLYLVPDRAAVLAEARRVLAPGGTLILMEPNQSGSLLEAALSAARGGAVATLIAQPLSAAKFACSMAAWRAFSGRVGRLSEERAEGLLRAAGFESVKTVPTLGRLGLHCVGR